MALSYLWPRKLSYKFFFRFFSFFFSLCGSIQATAHGTFFVIATGEIALKKENNNKLVDFVNTMFHFVKPSLYVLKIGYSSP